MELRDKMERERQQSETEGCCADQYSQSTMKVIDKDHTDTQWDENSGRRKPRRAHSILADTLTGHMDV